MSVVRVLFLGTPDFAVEPLEALAQDDHFQVVRVYTQPDKPAGRNLQVRPTPVKAKALELGLDVRNVANINDPEVVEEIRSLNADSAVVVAFGQILKEPFLKLFPHPAVNIHSSLLPRWRGAAPMQRALLADDKITGVSLQVIVKELDAGPIIGERQLPLTDKMNIETVYRDLKKLSCELLHIEFMDYIRGTLRPQGQDPGGVTIAKKIKKEEGQILWEMTSRQIFNQVRALMGWPGTWTWREGKMLKIHSVQIGEGVLSASPGQILEVAPSGIRVATGGGGAVWVERLQPESRAALSAEEFVRGYRVQVGEVWGPPSATSSKL